ncbi:MAG: hypothetical protein LAT84_00090 [Balneolia bacterium]|nr:hypothetical protein [Balneolia bacterium]
MYEVAIIEFGFLIIALALSYAHVRWLRSRKETLSLEQELKQQFNSEWNGTDSDEMYAWYRVRFQLNHLEAESKSLVRKLELVDLYIKRLSSHPMHSRTVIGEDGQLDIETLQKGDRNRDLFGY